MASGSRIFIDEKPIRLYSWLYGTAVRRRRESASYSETLGQCVRGLVGTGIFAMGWAFMNTGTLWGSILMIIIALINLHCQHLLIKACVNVMKKESVPVLPTFGEIFEYTSRDSPSPWLRKKAYGFGIITDVLLLAAENGACVVYMTFVAKHLNDVAMVHGWKQDYRIMLAIIVVPMWLSTFLGSSKLVAAIATSSSVIIWIGVSLILYYSIYELPPINERSLIISGEKMFMFFGIVLFAFSGITVVIPLHLEMAKPEQATSFCGILNVWMVICMLLYGIVGFFAYWRWGTEVLGSVFLNLPEQDTFSQVVKIVISVGVMLSYTLHMYVAFEIFYPRLYKKWGPLKNPLSVRIIYNAAAVFITYCLANITSNLAILISLVGTLSLAALCMFLPATLELIMLYNQLTLFIVVKNILIIIIAVIGSITGTVVSIIYIVKEYVDEKT